MRRARVLLATFDGAGNFTPERALVRALIARGHHLDVLAHDSQRSRVEDDGAAFVAWRNVLQYTALDRIPQAEEMPYFLEHILFAKGFGFDLTSTIDRLRPDVLLVDAFLFYALVAAKRSGLPTVGLWHTVYALLDAFAPLFEPRMAPVNDYAATLGLAPFPAAAAVIESPDVVLVFTHRAFDPVERVAPNVVHVGPLRATGAAPWTRRDPAKPFVVVGLSTSYQDQASLLQRICDALAPLDVEALVTTGAVVPPETLTAGANTTLVEFAPHDAVLPAADLLVTHAGHGTVMAGTTHGVPLLCLPMGRDQPLLARRVADLGVGRVGSADADAAEIRGAITTALADSDAKPRARAFARAVAGEPGVDEAVARVERLLRR